MYVKLHSTHIQIFFLSYQHLTLAGKFVSMTEPFVVHNLPTCSFSSDANKTNIASTEHIVRPTVVDDSQNLHFVT